MLSAEGSVRVDAAPRDVLELVCDLRAYMTLDRKIVRVYESPPIDSDGNGFVVFRGSIRSIRSPKQRQSVKLDRWWSVTFESAGPWLTDRLVWMRRGLTAQPFSGGVARHAQLSLPVQGPFRPVGRALRPRLAEAGRSRRASADKDLLRPAGRWTPAAAASAPTARTHRGAADPGQGRGLEELSAELNVAGWSARPVVRGWRPCGPGVGGPRRRPMRPAGRRPRSSGIPLCRRPAPPAVRTPTGRSPHPR